MGHVVSFLLFLRSQNRNDEEDPKKIDQGPLG
jgi:hypothetical protein